MWALSSGLQLIVDYGIYAAIGLCSVAALGIFLERNWSLRRNRTFPRAVAAAIEMTIARGKIGDAIALARSDSSALARIVFSGLSQVGRGRSAIKEAVTEIGRREAEGLGSYLGVISTVAGVAPLLGLLGTVIGMIRAFRVYSLEAATADPTRFAGAISLALYTTALGLSVAIAAVVGHKYLSARVDARVNEMEEFSFRLIDLLDAGERGVEGRVADFQAKEAR